MRTRSREMTLVPYANTLGNLISQNQQEFLHFAVANCPFLIYIAMQKFSLMGTRSWG